MTLHQLVADYKLAVSQENSELAADLQLQAQMQAVIVAPTCDKLNRYIRLQNTMNSVDLVKVSAIIGPHSQNAEVQAKAGPGSSQALPNFNPEIPTTSQSGQNQTKAFNACCAAQAEDATNNTCDIPASTPPQEVPAA